MKKSLVLAPLMAAVLALGAAGPASAHSAAPCDDSGGPGNSDYAQHHIVALAHQGALGNGGHKPGSHGGFSLCLGVHD
ncbi:MAG: hypothetical protein M3520_13380 [Actinomycetota bacterium]|jgi:hypothetical protein|nr:hypothetical protein [Actinomycetota bacterium]